MEVNLNRPPEPGSSLGHAATALHQALDKQRLRILRCTAQAMASGPGGLRFQAGTQPWLEGLDGSREVATLAKDPRSSARTRSLTH